MQLHHAHKRYSLNTKISRGMEKLYYANTNRTEATEATKVNLKDRTIASNNMGKD